MAGPGTELPTGAAKVAAVDAMFDAIAPRYDVCNRLISLGLDQGWRRRAVRALELAPGSVVLDLACGTGDLSRELVAAGLRPVGADRSGGMLSAAAARVRRAGGTLPLVRGDALSLPLRANSLDGVACGFGLRNFAVLPPALAECARTLRSGGRLAFLEVDTPPNRLMRLGHRVWFGSVVPRLGGLLSDPSAYRYLPRSVAYLPDPETLAAMVAGAGFTAVERFRLSGGIVQLIVATRT